MPDPAPQWMGNANTVLHGRPYQHYYSGPGALSLKAFNGGQAHYAVGPARYRVDSNSYLLLNAQETYTVEIASPVPIESCCVFFAAGFAEDVRRGLATCPERLLDEPAPTAADPVRFFERLYPRDDSVFPAVARLRSELTAAETSEPGALDERYHDLMARLLARHTELRREVDALPAARPATREELYRRLHVARDYAAALYAAPLTLDELATVACLSPSHLLRTFRAAFGQSPHQYLTALRLARARDLLRTTEISVTEVCLAVGYTSLGSFSALFRRHLGVSPERYRQDQRRRVADRDDFGEARPAQLRHTCT
jgi:AraC-like DNA-binding protein